MTRTRMMSLLTESMAGRLAGTAICCVAATSTAFAQRCPDVTDLLLTNGQIHTMSDQPGTDPIIFESVRVLADRIDRAAEQASVAVPA